MSAKSIFDDTQIAHRDGIAWHEAKRPFPLHKCRAQTTGFIGLQAVERCACGAIRGNNYSGWLRKNERWEAKSNPLVAGVIAGVIALLCCVAVFLIF